MTSKKIKVDEDSSKVFLEKWRDQYFCSEVSEKPVCLICKQAIRDTREYVIREHYITNHAVEYDKYEGSLREDKAKELERLLKRRLMVAKNARRVSDAAIKASYMIVYEMALAGKSSWDGNFLKKCMLMTAGLICPDKRQEFADVHLSKSTVGKRVLDISNQRSSQLREKVKTFVAFSVAVDRSLDEASVKLAVFIRGVDRNMEVTEEFVEIINLSETATSEEIFNSLVETLDELGVDWSQAVSLASDGMPPLRDTMTEVATMLKDKVFSINPHHTFFHLYSVLHQEVLYTKALKMKNVLDVVVNTVVCLQPSPSGKLYPMDIQRLCHGPLLKRFYGIHSDIHSVLQKAGKNVDELQDKKWQQDFAFLVDMKEHLDELKKKIVGPDKLITEFYDSLHAFEKKLQLLETQLSDNDLTHFPNLKSLLNTSDFPTETPLKMYNRNFSDLRRELQVRLNKFKNCEKFISVMRDPFSIGPQAAPRYLKSELTKLICDHTLKKKFSTFDVHEFYRHLGPSYSGLRTLAAKVFSMFGSTHVIEKLNTVWSQNKRESHQAGDFSLSHNSLIKIAASQTFSPDFEALIQTWRRRKIESPFSKVSTGNSTSTARSGESSQKNHGTSQETRRVRKYPNVKVESDHSSSDEECLRRNTFKATNPETGPQVETSQYKEPEVYIDVAECPENSKKRRLSTEKDYNVEGNGVSLGDWEFIHIKQELDNFEGFLTGEDKCDVEVKQEFDDSMELVKEEHIDDIDDH